jgi:RsiW-degrading membrane proteinase PrsW (M82 family)
MFFRVISVGIVLIALSVLVAERFIEDLQTEQIRTIGVYAIFFGLFVFFIERYSADDAKKLLIYPNHKRKPLWGVIIGALIGTAIGGVVLMGALALITWPIDLLLN